MLPVRYVSESCVRKEWRFQKESMPVLVCESREMRLGSFQEHTLRHTDDVSQFLATLPLSYEQSKHVHFQWSCVWLSSSVFNPIIHRYQQLNDRMRTQTIGHPWWSMDCVILCTLKMNTLYNHFKSILLETYKELLYKSKIVHLDSAKTD